MKILEITALGYMDGGIENGLILTRSIFEKQGHTVKIFASDLRPDLPHFNDYSFQIPKGIIGKLLFSFNLYAYRNIKKALIEFQPDIVSVHTVDRLSPSVLFTLKKYPTVLIVHGPEPFSKNLLTWCFPESDFKNGTREFSDLTFKGKLRYFYHRSFERIIYWLAFKNVDRIVTLSGYMHKLLEEEGLHNIQIENGTILFNYSPLAKDQITHTILCVGRLETYKGFDYLIKAMPEIMRVYPDSTLSIAGDGIERENLEKLSINLNIQNSVKFLGKRTRDELEEAYKASSIVVVPSTYPEAFGKIGIEAMSVGRPVVATDVGGISDWLINNENGYLVAPKDSGALARAILKIFSNSETYLAMQKKAREISEKFDLESTVLKTEKIFNNLIELYKG